MTLCFSLSPNFHLLCKKMNSKYCIKGCTHTYTSMWTHTYTHSPPTSLKRQPEARRKWRVVRHKVDLSIWHGNKHRTLHILADRFCSCCSSPSTFMSTRRTSPAPPHQLLPAHCLANCPCTPIANCPCTPIRMPPNLEPQDLGPDSAVLRAAPVHQGHEEAQTEAWRIYPTCGLRLQSNIFVLKQIQTHQWVECNIPMNF